MHYKICDIVPFGSLKNIFNTYIVFKGKKIIIHIIKILFMYIYIYVSLVFK